MIKYYLAYLKDISRKIVADSGFEKALLDKSRTNKSFAFQKTNNKLSFTEKDELYPRIKNIEDYLSKNNDKKLFCGFGLVAGTKGRQYAAPIIYVECEIFKEDSSYIIEFDFDTNSFNYDLITSILNYSITARYSVADDDVFNEDFQKEVDIVEKIENEIKVFDEVELLQEYANEIFQLLQTKLQDFKSIRRKNHNDYSYSTEINLFNLKPKKGRNSKKEPEDKRPRKSIFEEELVFIDSAHFFVNAIPHQLSTYEALRQLIQEIEKNKFQNKILEKMLTNVLTEQKIELKNNDETKVEEILKKYIPLSFSDSQISSIKNAFGSEISYIQGPPGTGKSYTIGAIVLCALFLNKKVLLVSQKEPALDVIKDKIEGYLTELKDDDFKGITYYKNTNKPELKSNISDLKKHGNNQGKLNYQLNQLSDAILQDDSWIKNQLSQIEDLERKLAANLQKEFEFKDTHNEFIRSRDWFLNQRGVSKELRLNRAYNFKTSGVNASSYTETLELVEKISYTTPTLASELFKHKFKTHINTHFDIDSNSIPDISLQQYCKDLIELHEKHVRSHKIRDDIRLDNEQIRSKLSHLKIELNKRQKLLLKRRFRHTTLSKISLRENQNAGLILENLDRLDKLLYWKKPSRIANQMAEINYNLIVDVMPFWLAEARYLGQVLPMKAEMFDLVIVDESSQVNLAEILPAFYRGKQIVIVGDHEQLGLDSTGVNFRLSNRFDNLIWEKNFSNLGISFANATDKKLTVTQCSILDFVRSPYNNVSIRTEMLKEHFRSMPALAKYTNANFYDGVLRIMTETPDKIATDCFQVIQVKGEREKQNKTIIPEAEKVIEIIRQLTDKSFEQNLFNEKVELNIPNFDSEKFSIGVISLMTNQRELIADLIEEHIKSDIIEKHNIEVWTPQSAQGNERDIIILSLCLDFSCNGMGNYHKNPRLLNVATSRAKKFTIVVHSGFQTDKYPQLGKYLNLTANRPEWTLNRAAYESEFEIKVYEQLREYVESRQDEADLRIFNQVETCGQKRLDFVVFNQTNQKAVAVEVDGSFHYQENGLSKQYSEEHTERIDILKRAGWNVINTPYYKWYRNGWLCDTNHPTFQKEIDKIIDELDYYLL
jgi:superfamily I DNA and/or RNA helicase